MMLGYLRRLFNAGDRTAQLHDLGAAVGYGSMVAGAGFSLWHGHSIDWQSYGLGFAAVLAAHGGANRLTNGTTTPAASASERETPTELAPRIDNPD